MKRINFRQMRINILLDLFYDYCCCKARKDSSGINSGKMWNNYALHYI